jgi:transcription elongation factor GreB
MSKAFTDEEAAPAPPIVRPRAPLPEGVPNYVTERGLALLHTELSDLAAEAAEPKGDLVATDASALAQRRAELEERIASAEVVAAPEPAEATIRFGATVTVGGASGERRYRIVGVDEADVANGLLSFVSPLARALVGHEAGDCVKVRTPRGEEEIEIVAVEYDC